jgi:DNA polymerase-1
MRVNKMWTQIAGPQKKKKDKLVGGGWLHHVNPRTGRVHGYVNPNGAVTGRMTHSNPNGANVDKKDARMRAMWEPMEGWKQLGADGSSLELCMLSHYLARYDGGSYGKKVTEGKKEDGSDPHTLTIRLLGMTKRDNGKRVIYAMIYGAGDAKLGLIIIEDYVEAGKDRPKLSPSKLGADAREKLETGIVGLGQLKKDIKKAFKRGYVRSLDGRKLWLRSEHSALNTLLQGAGAVVMKKALVLFHYEAIKRFRMKQHSGDRDADFGYMLNVHDEVQIECRTQEIAEELGKLFVASITRAGIELGVRCPLSGAYDIGNNWGETH